MGGARVLGAARLYKMGKAPLVLVTSGDPYVSSSGEVRQESNDMADLLVEYGVPKEAIVIETKARTTAENALYSAQLLKAKNIENLILVTSAFHMRRSVKLFEKQGLVVTPFATSHEIVGARRAQDYSPKAMTLSRSTLYLKEFFGRLIGR
jgi:uncharacterized SAM-binding protein YcdF (DUF218 family)